MWQKVTILTTLPQTTRLTLLPINRGLTPPARLPTTPSPDPPRRPCPLMASPSLHPLPHTRVPSLVFPTAVAASQFVAREIDKLVRARNAAGKPTVLGLATGST